MADRLNLLDKWKILEAIMRDLSLARNDLIVSQDLLEHYHEKVGGSRSSSRLIATRTGLARSRVRDCLDRLIDGGHFTTIAGQQRGSKAGVYAPRRREGGPVHGSSSAERGPVDGSTKSPGGPVGGPTNGPVGGPNKPSSGPVGGSNKPLRKSHLAPARSETSRLGPTTDAARSPSPPVGAPGRALPVAPTLEPETGEAAYFEHLNAAMAAKAAGLERLNAAATAGAAGGVCVSSSDLRDAHSYLFFDVSISFPEDIAMDLEKARDWARMCAALRAGEHWAKAWIEAAAAAERDEQTSGDVDGDRLEVIFAALKAGQAPSTA